MSDFFIKQAFAEAIDLQKNQKYDEAKKLYEKILKQDSKDANARHLIALIYMAEGNFDEAKKNIEIAISQAPDQPIFHSNYGALLHSMGNHKEAVVALEKSVKLDSNLFQSYYSLGIVYSDLNQHENAVEAYYKALNVNDKSAAAHNNLANLFSNTNNPEAEYHYKKLVELEPTEVYPRLNMANYYIKRDQFNEAISSLNELVDMGIATKEVYNSLGVSYKGLDDTKNAISMFEEAIKIDKDFVLANENLKLIKDES